ncbi:MAG TPA: hypothetical protein ENG30_02130 [Thermofilaceae archaeon]|nr:hypothetical protein [Thermofilaceae archaeon]
MSSMPLEVVLFGHIVMDTVVRGRRRWQSVGGTVVYGAFAALRHGAKPIVVSKVGEDFLDEYLIFLARNDVDISYVRVVPRGKTTRFKLVYRDTERELTLLSRAESIGRLDAELIDLSGRVAIVGPVAGEVELEALESVYSRARLTGLDLQGYLRTGRIREPIRLERSERALEALRYADVVHADENEARVLTGQGPPESARWMASVGPRIALVTLGDEGAYVAWEDRLIFVPPARPSQVVDVTGAGDVYLTVFSIEYARLGSVEEAAAMAAAAVSYLVEKPGVEGLRDRWQLRGRAQDVLKRIEEK